MRIILDTSSLIRFLTRDDKEKALKVKELLETEILKIPNVVFSELEYVLTKKYTYTRVDIVEFYRFLTSQNNIDVSKEVKIAVVFYKSSNLDMADCIIAAHSRKGTLASFDHDLLKLYGVKPYWK